MGFGASYTLTQKYDGQHIHDFAHHFDGGPIKSKSNIGRNGKHVIYSYGIHFPLGAWLGNACYVNMSNCGYTNSRTPLHQGMLLRALDNGSDDVVVQINLPYNYRTIMERIIDIANGARSFAKIRKEKGKTESRKLYKDGIVKNFYYLDEGLSEITSTEVRNILSTLHLKRMESTYNSTISKSVQFVDQYYQVMKSVADQVEKMCGFDLKYSTPEDMDALRDSVYTLPAYSGKNKKPADTTKVKVLKDVSKIKRYFSSDQYKKHNKKLEEIKSAINKHKTSYGLFASTGESVYDLKRSTYDMPQLKHDVKPFTDAGYEDVVLKHNKFVSKVEDVYQKLINIDPCESSMLRLEGEGSFITSQGVYVSIKKVLYMVDLYLSGKFPETPFTFNTHDKDDPRNRQYQVLIMDNDIVKIGCHTFMKEYIIWFNENFDRTSNTWK